MVELLRSIVIVGGGTAGWMAAAAFARFLPPGARIRLVESDEIGTVGVGEATIPQIRLFTQALGIDEDALLAAAAGTFKLGIAFDGWSRPGERYIHGFGIVGRARGIVPFHHFWLRGRALGLADPLDAYVPAAAAARAGRFARGDGDRREPGLAYAYHLDAIRLAAFLRGAAERGGVERVEGCVVDVALNGETGFVETVALADGRRIDGDLFIDCSGFAALLIGKALGVGFEDWSRWLPCDRAVAVGSRRTGPPPPLTRATARDAGWQWRIPLQHRTGNGHVYSSAHVSDDEAAATLLADLDGPAIGEPRLVRFATGRRRRGWERNVVALGLAAGFLEPLESTSIHLVQSGIARLLGLFPDARIDAAARDAYNRATDFEIERIRDFLILHYHANARDGDFWRELREMDVPDALAEKLRQFRAGGRIVRDADELFAEPGWLQVMIGQGVVPEAWSPLAEAMSRDELAAYLRSVSDAVDAQVSALPQHGDFVAQHCREMAA